MVWSNRKMIEKRQKREQDRGKVMMRVEVFTTDGQKIYQTEEKPIEQVLGGLLKTLMYHQNIDIHEIVNKDNKKDVE